MSESNKKRPSRKNESMSLKMIKLENDNLQMSSVVSAASSFSSDHNILEGTEDQK